MNSIKHLAAFVLLFNSVAFALANPQGRSVPTVQPGLVQVSNTKLEKVRLTSRGGQLHFKHQGQILNGDMTNTKVYMMRGGKKVEIPRSQWNMYLKSGVPMTLTIKKTRTQGLVVIAIIAILIGMLYPAIQK